MSLSASKLVTPLSSKVEVAFRIATPIGNGINPPPNISPSLSKYSPMVVPSAMDEPMSHSLLYCADESAEMS